VVVVVVVVVVVIVVVISRNGLFALYHPFRTLVFTWCCLYLLSFGLLRYVDDSAYGNVSCVSI